MSLTFSERLIFVQFTACVQGKQKICFRNAHKSSQCNQLFNIVFLDYAHDMSSYVSLIQFQQQLLQQVKKTFSFSCKSSSELLGFWCLIAIGDLFVVKINPFFAHWPDASKTFMKAVMAFVKSFEISQRRKELLSYYVVVWLCWETTRMI